MGFKERPWIVSRGKRWTNKIATDPEKLVELCDGSNLPSGEELMYVAEEAFEAITGSDGMYDEKPSPALSLRGKSWKVEDLPKRAPKTWKIFKGYSGLEKSRAI